METKANPQTNTDPRGPVQHITAVEVEETPSRTWVTLDCGHISEMNQIYTYKIGAEMHCFHCGPFGSKAKGVKFQIALPVPNEATHLLIEKAADAMVEVISKAEETGNEALRAEAFSLYGKVLELRLKVAL